ncbi:hypothetical protein J6590_055880 [Homalodisca vitripennis]|nr:hypothetical protein J6590_055880 [Homalodisca vitripennis]
MRKQECYNLSAHYSVQKGRNDLFGEVTDRKVPSLRCAECAESTTVRIHGLCSTSVLDSTIYIYSMTTARLFKTMTQELCMSSSSKAASQNPSVIFHINRDPRPNSLRVLSFMPTTLRTK